MKRLFSARDVLEAQELRLFLESHGVRAEVCDDNSVLGTAFSFTPTSAPSVHVNDVDFDKAAELLDRYRSEVGTAPANGKWICPNCGRTIEAQFDACWKCESPRGDAPSIEQALPHTFMVDAPQDAPASALPAEPCNEPMFEPVQIRREIWLEVVVVLCVTWLPYFFLGLFSWLFPDSPTNWPYVVESLWGILGTVPIIAVVLYVIYRSGLPWSEFGIKHPRYFSDFGIGVLIWLAMVGIHASLYNFFATIFGGEAVSEIAETTYQFSQPLTTLDYALLVLFSICIAFSEELAMRGYLIPRFERLFRSIPLSIGLSSALFASYHIYQGIGPMLQILLMGIVFGALFSYLRRLWPLVIAHAIMNIVASVP